MYRLLIAALLIAAGCSVSDTDVDDVGDTGPPADDVAELDAGADTNTDTGFDAGDTADAGPDVGPYASQRCQDLICAWAKDVRSHSITGPTCQNQDADSKRDWEDWCGLWVGEGPHLLKVECLEELAKCEPDAG